MKPTKREYKVTVRFSQELPIIVKAFNAVRAKEAALEKARSMAIENEQLEVVGWTLVEKEK